MRFCPKCGAQRFTDMPFCGSCGVDFRELTPQAAPRRTRRRAGLAVVALVLAAVASSVGLAACSSTTGSAARATPDDAVKQYIEGVAAADAKKILGASAIDEAAEHFDFAYQVERLNAIVPTSLMPSDYPFYVEMNKYARAASILGQVHWLEVSIAGKPVYETVTKVTKEEAQQYIKDVDPARLAGMTVVDLKFPVASLASNTKALDNFARMAKVYGADELTERLALVQVNGSHYAVGFQLARYGGDWKVLGQVSNLAGTSSSGAAEPITPANFAASVAK